MLHEFEEMIILPPWVKKNENDLYRRFPALRSKFSFLKSPVFGITVCEEFIIISACTIATIATENILFWYVFQAIGVTYRQYSFAESILLVVLSLTICITNLYLMQKVTPRIYRWITNKI